MQRSFGQTSANFSCPRFEQPSDSSDSTRSTKCLAGTTGSRDQKFVFQRPDALKERRNSKILVSGLCQWQRAANCG